MSNEESFFREVDDDYRRDQTIKFFRDYGSYFVAAAFVIVAVVGGYTFETRRRAEKAATGGDALTHALVLSDAGKKDEAQKAFAALSQNGPGTYQIIARLHEAAEAVAKNQKDAAVQAYQDVANDAAAPAELRDLARLQAASLSVDKESYAALSQSLETYRAGNSPWRFSAKEILGLSAYKEGKRDEAERLFGEIVRDGDAPQAMRQRAEVMMALLFEKPKPAQTDTTGKKDGANDAKTQ